MVLENGRKVFVPRVIEGETVQVEPEPGSRRLGRARLVDVIEPSPERVVPPCRHANRCGGCDLMHLSIPGRLRLQRQHAAQLLAGVDGADEPLPVVQHQPTPALGYRFRARFTVRGEPKRARVGYRAARSHRLVEVDECPVLREELAGITEALAQLLGGSAGAGHGRAALGTLGRPVATIAWTGEIGAGVFGRAARLCERGRFAGIELWPEDAREPARYGDPTPVMAGVDGQPLYLAPGGFAQPSEPGALALARHVATRIDSGDRVVELFAGSGTLSIALAARAAEITCVESSGLAVAALRGNLQTRAIDARIVEADANRFRIARKTSTVVLDPPRAGAREAVEQIVAAHPRRVVYVSCHPATLARDLRALVAAGYRMEALDLFDLFPQTRHFESVAVLRR